MAEATCDAAVHPRLTYTVTSNTLIPVCYALFIYLLNLFLAFLQPKFDPQLYDDLASQDIEEGEPGLPTSASAASSGKSGAGGGGLMSGVFGNPGSNGSAQNEEEFRPFIRRLPEFKVSSVVPTRVCTLQPPQVELNSDVHSPLRSDSSGSRRHRPFSSRSSAH